MVSKGLGSGGIVISGGTENNNLRYEFRLREIITIITWYKMLHTFLRKLPYQRQCDHQENGVNKNGKTRVQPSNNY